MEGSPSQIVNDYSKQFGELITIEFDSKVSEEKTEKYLKKGGFNIREIESHGTSISFISMDLGSTPVDVIGPIKSLKSNVVNIDIKKPTLEDVFNYVLEQRQ